MITNRAQARKKYPKGIEKLEVGSGQNPEAGYVHLDIQKDLPYLDILADVRKMPLPDNFVTQEIRAVHIMEHFCHPEYAGDELKKKFGTTVEVLQEAYRVLAPGGKLKIVTPDIAKISKSMAKKRIPDEWIQRWCVGGHLDEYDVHHWLWTKKDAKKWFSQVGFKKLRDWNLVKSKASWQFKWKTEPKSGNMKWHEIEWYHWLFFEGTK